MKLREATSSDADQIRKVYMAAFDKIERESVADLAINLLSNASSLQILNLVADEPDAILGHISFSPVRTKSKDEAFGYILAPLAVNPENQKKGIGSSLVREGIQILTNRGAEIVFVYGDPDYYGRFGFLANSVEKFIPPYTLKHPFGWQALTIKHADYTTEEKIECINPLNKPELW